MLRPEEDNGGAYRRVTERQTSDSRRSHQDCKATAPARARRQKPGCHRGMRISESSRRGITRQTPACRARQPLVSASVMPLLVAQAERIRVPVMYLDPRF